MSDYKIETGKNFIAKVFVFYIFISNVKAYLHLLGSKKENKHFPQISGVAPLLRLTDLPQATNLKCQMVYQQREKTKKHFLPISFLTKSQYSLASTKTNVNLNEFNFEQIIWLELNLK